MPPTIALVPLRSPGLGKTRLRGVLDVGQRAALAAAMLADVLAALRSSPLDDVVVAASDPAAATAVTVPEVRVVLDPPDASSLDDVLAAAAAGLPTGADLLVVAGDLPRLTASDVSAVLDEDAEVVVAPSHRGGTGGLLRRPRARIATAYGRGSAEAHASLAREAGASLAIVRSPGFLDDVDLATDLASLRTGPLGPATAEVVAHLGIAGADRSVR